MMSQPGVFEHTFRVSPADIDRLGHINNVVYTSGIRRTPLLHTGMRWWTRNIATAWSGWYAAMRSIT